MNNNEDREDNQKNNNRYFRFPRRGRICRGAEPES